MVLNALMMKHLNSFMILLIRKTLHVKNIVIFVFLVMVSCTNMTKNKSEYIFVRKDGYITPFACYLLAGKVMSVYSNNDTCFIYDSIQNTVFNSCNDMKYYPIKCIENYNIPDTIKMANSMFGISHSHGVIFNAEIIGQSWQVGVYYPYDVKGTYKFNITSSELNLFNCALHRFVFKIPITFQDTSYCSRSKSVLLVEFFLNEKIRSYIRQIDEKTYTTRLINDLTMIIIKNHLQNYNKISDKVLFSEFRKKIKNDAIKEEFKLSQ